MDVLARNADPAFSTASSIKLAILLELYRQDGQVVAQEVAKGQGETPGCLYFRSEGFG